MRYHVAIQKLLEESGMTQAELASRVGCSRPYISQIVRDRRTPSDDTIVKLAKAFDVPVHLISLLAAEECDLRNIDVATARRLSRDLLATLREARA